ncbi:hypothetical protein GCM10009850_047630 [Nonomuraea monospora]|uniref:Uncharacterized protein n=1 Tax=Nonomuraea monospora TaxID=568818 RepID=A0ABP5PC25_9ACTN
MLVVTESIPRRLVMRLAPLQNFSCEAYRQNMGRGDDDDPPPICGTCMGQGGEWIEMNGKKGKERKWVKCTACNGTGRR